MWLFLETTRPDAFTVGRLTEKIHAVRTIQARSHAILKECMRLALHPDLQGICVVSGPGSFTSTRTGVLIANILSRMLQRPLVGVTIDEARNLQTLAARLHSGHVQSSAYVAPVYSSEPNITVKVC